MLLNKNWRILTVGDGDLSFSNAISEHINPSVLVASTYDSSQCINEKYSDNALTQLQHKGIKTLTSFDVTNKASWQRLQSQHFDVVIFQFPLIPAFKGKQAFNEHTAHYSLNTLNRALLHQFIANAHQYALDPSGPMLCYITSKDVKPYREWNIEGSLVDRLDCHYLGQMPFDISHFPGYKIRNVDRDKHVKDTSGITYVFSHKLDSPISGQLKLPAYLNAKHCTFCRVGPYMADEDEQKHLISKKHKQMQAFEDAWQTWLTEHYTKDPL